MQLFPRKGGKKNRAEEKEDICLISLNYHDTDNDIRIKLYVDGIQFPDISPADAPRIKLTRIIATDVYVLFPTNW